MPSETSVTIVVPVFNEEQNLPPLLAEITRAMDGGSRSWDVLFVNDCSTDGSLAVIKALAGQDPRVRYLSFRANRGQSAAFAAGFAHASGDVVVTIDADLQNDPADIPALLDTMDRQDVDMVIGWRRRRQDTWVKRASSRLANRLRDWWTRETVRDTGCSLKAMRTPMARRLHVFKNMHRYLPTLVKMQGGTVAEVPVNHRPRVHGVSKYGTWDRAKAGAYDLIGVRWLQDRAIRYDIDERN